MQTAKSLGFKKGDFVHTGLFPGIIVQDVHTGTPMCEVWGIEHECGSAYATDLRKINYDQFTQLVSMQASAKEVDTPYTDEAKRAIKAAKEAKHDHRTYA